MEPITCILIMGVSGCGKSTIASELSSRLSPPPVFLDADAFHPPENIAKMKNGIPLTDDDRWGWLQSIRDHILSLPQHEGGIQCVLGCSALKKRYRDFLRQGSGSATSIRWKVIFLRGSFQLIESRVSSRKDHFMPAKLLQSQFEALEEPDPSVENALWIDLDSTSSVEEIITRCLQWLV